MPIKNKKFEKDFGVRRLRQRGRSGQAMLIAILTLGGAILGATTLAGLLMLYQIRSNNDSVNSAKAIFAADSGVNWALYDYYNSATPLPGSPSGTLSNAATVSVTCSDANGNAISCDDQANAVSAISEGVSNTSRRAFLLDLTGSTETLP